MTITAKVIAHSRADGAPDLITLQVKYPRMIHAECKTHRVIRIDDAEYEFLQEISLMDDENLSRNASSSRAIPIERMIRDVEEDPAMPVAWGSNKPGMQAGAELTGAALEGVKTRWIMAAKNALHDARAMAELGAHKQIVNRILEPFGHISVVITSSEWDNFFDLRCHPDADPTMRAVAEAMQDAIAGSTPGERIASKSLSTGETWYDAWHLPYVTESDWDYAMAHMESAHPWSTLAMISAARSARVSYLNHDGTSPDIKKDLALAERLLASKHMSPFEHQAQADIDANRIGKWGNFTGWAQHRKMLESAA